MVVVEEVKDGLELGAGVGGGEGRRKEEGGRREGMEEIRNVRNVNSYVRAYISVYRSRVLFKNYLFY